METVIKTETGSELELGRGEIEMPRADLKHLCEASAESQ